MNIGKNGSWLEIQCLIPFRTWYLYWDREPFLADYEFKKRKTKVRKIVGYFTHIDYPYCGVIISCWRKDKNKVQSAMDELDRRLEIIDGKNYKDFLLKWHQSVLNFTVKNREEINE